MGSQAKFHTRKVLPIETSATWEIKDDFFFAAEKASLRAKAYNSSLRKRAKQDMERMKSQFTKYRRRLHETGHDSGSRCQLVDDPVSLAASRARNHKKSIEKKELESRRQSQERKWYKALEPRPLSAGDMETIKKRSDDMIRKARAQKKREEKKKIGHRRQTRRATEKVKMEAYQIMKASASIHADGNTTGGLKNSVESVMTMSTDKDEIGAVAIHTRPWFPTGYKNPIEWTRGTKTTNEDILRTFSYAKEVYNNTKVQSAEDMKRLEQWTYRYEQWIRNKRKWQPPKTQFKTWTTQ